MKRYYQRKLAKTNVIIAKKAVAHKLARVCFYVLRDQVVVMLTKHLVIQNDDIDFKVLVK